MKWALTHLGFNVEIISSDPDTMTRGKKHFHQLDSMDSKARVTAILNSQSITRAEVESITKQNCISFSDEARIKKYEIQTNYQKCDITDDDIHFDDKFCNKSLFEHIWSDGTKSTNKYCSDHVKVAKILKQILLTNEQYLGSDGLIRLSRQDAFVVAKQVYGYQELLIKCTKSVKFKEIDTQNKATKLLNELLSSLGYYWPGYNGDKKVARIALDNRAKTYREYFC